MKKSMWFLILIVLCSVSLSYRPAMTGTSISLYELERDNICFLDGNCSGGGGGTSNVSANCNSTGSCSAGDVVYLNYQNEGNFTLMGGEYTYALTSFPINYSGTCYDTDFDIGPESHNSYFIQRDPFLPFTITPDTEPITINTNDEDIGVLTVNIADFYYITMFFKNSDFVDETDFDTFFEALVDMGGDAVTVTYYKESFFVYMGYGNDYALNNTDSVVSCSNADYTTPPTIIGYPGVGYHYDSNLGNVEMNKNVSVGVNLDVDGSVRVGSVPGIPRTNYAGSFQAAYTGNLSAGFPVFLGVGFTGIISNNNPTTGVSVYGLFGGAGVSDDGYSGTNYTGNIAAMNPSVLIKTDGKVTSTYGFLSGLAMQKTGGNVTSFRGIAFNIYEEGDYVSEVNSITTLDGINMDATYSYKPNVTDIQQLYCPDNTEHVNGNHYCIYSLDDNYFGAHSGFGSDILLPQYPIHVGNESDTNNVSIYAEGEIHGSKFVTHTSFPTDPVKSKNDILAIKSDNKGKYDMRTVSDDLKSPITHTEYVYKKVPYTEEVEHCVPDSILGARCTRWNETKYKIIISDKKKVILEGVDIGLLNGKLVQAVQEQQKYIDNLKSRIEVLEKATIK